MNNTVEHCIGCGSEDIRRIGEELYSCVACGGTFSSTDVEDCDDPNCGRTTCAGSYKPDTDHELAF